MRYASPAGLVGCHCATAFAACSRCLSCRCAAADAGLRLPPWMAEMPVLQEQKPALSPDVRRSVSLRTSLARVPAGYSLRSPFGPACGCYSRWSLPRLPKPMTHTRPRGRLQASCLSPCGPAFGCSILFQQNCPCPWPLVWSHPNDAIGFGKLRAGTNGP